MFRCVVLCVGVASAVNLRVSVYLTCVFAVFESNKYLLLLQTLPYYHFLIGWICVH